MPYSQACTIAGALKTLCFLNTLSTLEERKGPAQREGEGSSPLRVRREGPGMRVLLAAVTAFFVVSAFADPVDIKLPSQPLSAALREFARQTGIQVAIQSELTVGKTSPSLSGKYEPAEALAVLLKDTGLIAYPVNQNTYGIREVRSTTAKSDKIHTTSYDPSNNPLGLAETNASDSREAPLGPENKSSDSATEKSENKPVLEEIIVTGSYLRTTEAATASPVTVITQEDIKKMGYNTVEDVIRSLPQNYSNINAATSLDTYQNTVDAPGQSAADLRGLGAQNTLVLVNGRRRAVSSTFGDVVNLNTIPIGSIDRIEIMTDGASAVYGSDAIAGVINFILKKDYQGGETHLRRELGHNGGDSTALEQTLGDSWTSGNVTFSGRYARTNPVDSRRAGFTTSNLTDRGGDDWRFAQAGQPGVVFGLGSLPAGDNGTHGIAGKLSPGNVVPYDRAAYPFDLAARTTSLSFDLNAEQSLNSWARVYGEATFTRNTAESNYGPNFASFVTVPATNAYNDMGAPLTVGYVFGRETQFSLLPPNESTSNQKALGAVLGFKVALPKDWTLDISANHSREDAYFDRVAFDPALLAARLSGVDAQGNPIPANQQLNVFGNGTAQNPAALAGLMHGGMPGNFINDNYSVSDSGLLTAEGALWKLPGGDMRMAAGGEFRRESLNYLADSSRSSLYLIATPGRKVKAVFGELNIPLVGEHNRIPGVHSLNLYGAGRWEQYAISGPFDGPQLPSREVTFSQTSPKVGISWYVWQPLKLRATYSKSFRAPELTTLFGSSAGPFNFLPIVDPKNPGLGTIYPPVYFAGNPALHPETADGYTAGLDWKPTQSLHGLAVALTYSRIDFLNRISGASNFLREPNVFFNLPGVVERDASGQISRINLLPVNISKRRSENADLQAAYDIDTVVGRLTFGFSGTYAIKLEDFAGPGSPPVVQDGTDNGPERVKGRSWVSWSRNNVGLNWYTNYSSSYLNTYPSLTSLPPQSVAHYTTFDLTGFYKFPGGLSINAGTRNLTNAAFPFYNYFLPWDSRRVDTRGRIVYLEFAWKYGFDH